MYTTFSESVQIIVPQAYGAKIVDITYDDIPKLLYCTINLWGWNTVENGQKLVENRRKLIFLLLQIHNRSIDFIDSCYLSFCRLLDEIWPACKEYNYHLADLAVGNSNCGTNKITGVIPWIFSIPFLKGELPVNILSFIIQFIVLRICLGKIFTSNKGKILPETALERRIYLFLVYVHH